MKYKLDLAYSNGPRGQMTEVTTGWLEGDDEDYLEHYNYLKGVAAEEPEPPFDENHYRYHTPKGPNPECPNCVWLNWSQP